MQISLETVNFLKSTVLNVITFVRKPPLIIKRKEIPLFKVPRDTCNLDLMRKVRENGLCRSTQKLVRHQYLAASPLPLNCVPQ